MAFAGTRVLTWAEMACEGEVQIRSTSRVLAFNMAADAEMMSFRAPLRMMGGKRLRQWKGLDGETW